MVHVRADPCGQSPVFLSGATGVCTSWNVELSSFLPNIACLMSKRRFSLATARRVPFRLLLFRTHCTVRHEGRRFAADCPSSGQNLSVSGGFQFVKFDVVHHQTLELVRDCKTRYRWVCFLYGSAFWLVLNQNLWGSPVLKCGKRLGDSERGPQMDGVFPIP